MYIIYDMRARDSACLNYRMLVVILENDALYKIIITARPGMCRGWRLPQLLGTKITDVKLTE